MKNISRYVFFLIIIATFFLGCDFQAIYDKSYKIPDKTWNWNNDLLFQPEIIDTLKAHNIYVMIRNDNNYALSNMYLFITVESPNGNVRKDTLSLMLADATGKWQGKRFAGTFEHEIPVYKGVRMPVAGVYSIKLTQGTRVKNLQGIHDVGLRIVKQ
jgi:gliding motility-associated lipoprotein GldH